MNLIVLHTGVGLPTKDETSAFKWYDFAKQENNVLNARNHYTKKQTAQIPYSRF